MRPAIRWSNLIFQTKWSAETQTLKLTWRSKKAPAIFSFWCRMAKSMTCSTEGLVLTIMNLRLRTKITRAKKKIPIKCLWIITFCCHANRTNQPKKVKISLLKMGKRKVIRSMWMTTTATFQCPALQPLVQNSTQQIRSTERVKVIFRPSRYID